MKLIIDKKKEFGGTLVEYALLVALMCVVVIASVRALGNRIDMQLSDATRAIATAGGANWPGG